jgi:hypothetical protein
MASPTAKSTKKGKGKEKRKIAVVDDNEDDSADIVDTTERQYRRKRRNGLEPSLANVTSYSSTPIAIADDALQVSTDGQNLTTGQSLPAGLAIMPLPASLLDYKDLVPDGILQALDSFVPIPVSQRLRKRVTTINSEPTLPTMQNLQKELATTQAMLIERDAASDEKMEALQLLSEEVKLWVRRCRQVVDVLQQVEIERDNYRAGEGVAKEQGRGIQVKLEDTGGDETVPPGTGLELAETKAQLALIKSQADDYKARLDVSEAERATDKKTLTHTEGLLSNSKAELAGMAWRLNDENSDCEDELDETMAEVTKPQSPLDLAIKERDKHRRQLIDLQWKLSLYKESAEESTLERDGLKAQLRLCTAERDSLIHDLTREPTATSIEGDQPIETVENLRAKIMVVERMLKGSGKRPPGKSSLLRPQARQHGCLYRGHNGKRNRSVLCQARQAVSPNQSIAR